VKVPKIVMVNCWSDSNKGDSAIIEGTINILYKVFPSAYISLLSMFTEKDPRFKTAFRHLRGKFPEVKFAGSPMDFSSYITKKRNSFFCIAVLIRIEKVFRKAGQIMYSLLFLLFLKLKRTSTPNYSIGIIKEADFVLSTGGHYFASPGRNILDIVKGLMGIYVHCYPLIIANENKVPFVICGQSVGPFDSILSRWFIKYCFKRASYIWVRENLSKNELLRCGIPEKKIQVVPDAAFALKPHCTERVKEVLQRKGLSSEKFIAVSVRQWDCPYYKNYIDEVAKTIDYIITEMGIKVAVIVQTMGPTNIENDLISSRQLISSIRQKEQVVLVDEDFSPSELACFYGKSLILIGTRFHSVILSFLEGVPSVAISYFGPKSHGIMKMFDMERYTLDLRSISSEKLIPLVEELIFNRKKVSDHISKKVLESRKQLYNIFLDLKSFHKKVV